MNIVEIVKLLKLLTPYIVLVSTLMFEKIKDKNNKIPIIRIKVDDGQTSEIKYATLSIENISDYHAFDYKIYPELEICDCNNTVTESNMLFSKESKKYLINLEKEKEIAVVYKDEWQRQHNMRLKVYIHDKDGDIRRILEINKIR